MAENSGIEWTDHTFNPWIGCTKVSPACEHCYAEASTPVRVAKSKYGLKLWGPESTGAVRRMASDDMWNSLRKWNLKAMEAGKPAKVFVASLADVFEEFHGPVVQANGEETLLALDDLRQRLWDAIASYPWLRFLLLTKRPENVNAMVPKNWADYGLPDNVWLGTTAENQEHLETRLTPLLQVKSRVRFLSVEPMLGPLSVQQAIINSQASVAGRPWNMYLQWIIAGGETQNGSRPMRLRWVRHLRDDAQAMGIAFHFKQWGDWAPFSQLSEEARGLGCDAIETPDKSGETYLRLGKTQTGRMLDGRAWDEEPGLNVE